MIHSCSLIVSGLYGDRYDNRKALSDWDYHNNIKAKASIIHIKQVKFRPVQITIRIDVHV